MTTLYNKLVRDKIPEIIREKGEKPVIHVANEQEYREKLRQKLQEEIVEFFQKPSAEEAVDILEVLYALCLINEIDPMALEDVRTRKADERGGFQKRIILDRTE